MLHGAYGQVCALGSYNCVTMCAAAMRSVGKGTRSLHPANSPLAGICVFELLSPSSPSQAHPSRLGSERGCKLRFPEFLVTPEFLLGSANRGRPSS